jgi:hypothetical protein
LGFLAFLDGLFAAFATVAIAVVVVAAKRQNVKFHALFSLMYFMLWLSLFAFMV